MEERKRRVYIGYRPGHIYGDWVVKIENGGDDGCFNGTFLYPTYWLAVGSYPQAILEESAEQWLRDNNLVRGTTQG